MDLVDTSVLVAYLCPEPLHAQVRRVLAAARMRVITPMIRLETASALAMKTRIGELDIPSAKLVLAELDRQVEEGLFSLQEIGAGDYQRACDLLAGFNTRLRTVDALHLACAAGSGARLLTADRVLADAAKTLGLSCKWIHG